MNILEKVTKKMNLIADISAAANVLQWDLETYMPSGSIASRAEQMATLEGLAHQYSTDQESISLAQEIRALQADSEKFQQLDTETQRMLQLFAKSVEQSIKIPQELVAELAKTQAVAQQAWKKARETNDFELFAPHLEKIVELTRKKAEYLGYSDDKHSALIDLFEEGMTVSELKPLFERLKYGVLRLLEKVRSSKKNIDSSVIISEYNTDSQIDLSRQIVEKMGFDFTRGRIDLTAHPFCTNFSIDDVRLTTRVYPQDFRACVYGTIHEAGHGMYEQGVNPRYNRTFAAGGTTMGIHESQSLFWEDIIARSEEFCTWFLPKLQEVFPENCNDLTSEILFGALNEIKPSFIRVDADELTYHLHIIMRFELENDIVNGRLAVRDIPQAWNEKMKEYLGIVPETNSLGCLQDVHWSFGLIGYFPSYSLGKLYAAMFWKQIQKEHPQVLTEIQNGEFATALAWMRAKIHQFGKLKTPRELVLAATGQELSETAYLDYIEQKINKLYY